jgi:hypothetical protein
VSRGDGRKASSFHADNEALNLLQLRLQLRFARWLMQNATARLERLERSR